MKARDAPKLDAIRFLSAALKAREIELRAGGGALGDAEAVTTIQKLAKQRRDSIESYQQGARARPRGRLKVLARLGGASTRASPPPPPRRGEGRPCG